MLFRTKAILTVICCLSSISVSFCADWGMKEGTPEIKSAGPLAFGPDGILFVGDSKSATIFAIATGDSKRASFERPESRFLD